VCNGICEHLHDPVSVRVDLGSLGEPMHLEHITYVNSYVGVAWPDA